MSLNILMPDSPGRSGAVLTALVLLVSLALASCQALRSLGGNSGLDEANQLNRSAGEDLREIEKIVQENKSRESEVTRAINAGDYATARRIMDDTVKAIDRGLERGQSAADKLDQASRLDIDPTVKQYLSLRAQWINKTIEAFKELRKGIITFRDDTGSTDKAASAKAKNELQQTSERFDQLMNEAGKLERQADDLARSNPEKIKPGS